MSLNTKDENLKTLYKYREISDPNGATNKNTLRMIEYGEIYFSKPSSFNDPFDAKLDYDFNASSQDIKKHFKKIGLPDHNIDNLIQNIKSGVFKFNTLAFGNGTGYADIINIFCLSKNCNNILMWSHYAKDHTGICVGFKVHHWAKSLNIKIKPGFSLPAVNGIENNLLPAVNVEYNNEKPSPYNIFKHSVKELEPFFKRKSELWTYEEEVRLMITDNQLLRNPVCVEQNEIVELIFGLKTPESVEKEIYSKLKDSNIKIYKSVMVTDKYELAKEPYKNME